MNSELAMNLETGLFKDTNGTAPGAGIDLEPNSGNTINNVSITGSQFLDNFGGGRPRELSARRSSATTARRRSMRCAEAV